MGLRRIGAGLIVVACVPVFGVINLLLGERACVFRFLKTAILTLEGTNVRDSLEERVDKLAGVLERMRLDEYLDRVTNRRRMIWENLLYGMVRGVGYMIGFTVLGAVVLVLLGRLASDNVPVIGEFLAEVLAEMEACKR